MNLDHELRRALPRLEPPPGFAERTLARVNEGATGTPPRPRSVNRWLAAAVAASIVLTTVGVGVERRRRQVEADRVRAEVALALRVTGDSVRVVQARLEAAVRRRVRAVASAASDTPDPQSNDSRDTRVNEELKR